PQTVVHFRTIEIKERPPAKPPGPGLAPGTGVLTLRFEPGTYSAKVTEFGVVVNVVGADRTRPSRQTIKPGEKVSTTYPPGVYTLEVSEPGELELSRARVTLAPKGEETVTLRPRPG